MKNPLKVMPSVEFGAVTSTVAALTFLTPPTIVLQPVPVTVIAGENATFTVTVTNTTTLPITYQWRKASTVITNILLNAHTCAFTLYNVQTNITATNGPGGYRVVVMNAANSSGLASPIVALTVITAAPPAALTGVAGNISDSGAMPSGSVDPKGSTTMAHFEYGLTASYGMTTPVVNAGNGTNSIPFSQILTGLLSGTTYHYRLVASNTGGTTSGVDQMFITLAAGPRLALVPDGSGGYFLRFDAIPSLTYRVQRSSSLTGMWDTISNPTAPSSGLVEYHDTTAPPGRAFYRTVQP